MKRFPDELRKECLYLARKTVNSWVRGQGEPVGYDPVDPEMGEPYGAFVTLNHRGRLRGCIGYIQAVKPLWETIADCAVSACSRDHRFPPVRPEELQGIEIDISILSPLQTVQNEEEIVVGVHGLIISKGGRRGLLLPQVPVEQGWDRALFLQHTCMKAGLPADAWRSGAVMEVFSADVFSEGEYGLLPEEPRPPSSARAPR